MFEVINEDALTRGRDLWVVTKRTRWRIQAAEIVAGLSLSKAAIAVGTGCPWDASLERPRPSGRRARTRWTDKQLVDGQMDE